MIITVHRQEQREKTCVDMSKTDSGLPDDGVFLLGVVELRVEVEPANRTTVVGDFFGENGDDLVGVVTEENGDGDAARRTGDSEAAATTRCNRLPTGLRGDATPMTFGKFTSLQSVASV